MQTNTLPIQLNAAQPNTQRPNANANADAGQFSAALSREIGQRHDLPPPAPMPAPKAPVQPKQQEAARPAGEKSPAPAPAKPVEAKAADKADKTADADDAGKDATESASQAAAAQVTDMLALVASLNQPAQAAATAAAGDPAAALGKAVARPGADAGQLAALQAAVKGQDKDAGGEIATKAFAVLDQGAAAAGIAADAKADTKGAPDLRAFQEAAAGHLKAQPEAAQAREAKLDAAALKEPAPVAQAVAQGQAASTLESVQAAAAAPADRLSARVGTPAWDNQVGQKVVWMAAGKEQSATLTLNPPDLGPMQVVLNVSNDQASIAFSSSHEEVRQALENAMPRLREMMGESGIALGNATVDAGMPDQRQAQQGGDQPRSHGAASRFDNGPAVQETVVRPAQRVTALGERGMVDTFA